MLVCYLPYCQLFLLSNHHMIDMYQERIALPGLILCSISQLRDVAVFPATMHKEMLSHTLIFLKWGGSLAKRTAFAHLPSPF